MSAETICIIILHERGKMVSNYLTDGKNRRKSHFTYMLCKWLEEIACTNRWEQIDEEYVRAQNEQNIYNNDNGIGNGNAMRSESDPRYRQREQWSGIFINIKTNPSKCASSSNNNFRLFIKLMDGRKFCRS